MKLSFYYHSLAHKTSDNKVQVPSYIGVFIDSLANQVEHLFLLLHENAAHLSKADYIIQANNITWINLGAKKSSWYRSLFPYKSLKTLLETPIPIDVLLVRGPSPLAPYFAKVFKPEKINYLIVGDYSESVRQGTGKGLRNRIIDKFLLWNDKKLTQVVRSSNVIVNSTSLFNKYDGKCKKLYEIKTTTLSKKDIVWREDSFINDYEEVNILFTGRINWQKGLKELFISVSQLIKKGLQINLHIVGWEDNDNKPVEKALLAYALENGFENQVYFHGRKKVGDELNAYYRNAQIYVLPTFHEGFPRTIWEAMASGTPVISTPVGSIPYYLTSEVNCLLVAPRDTEQLRLAIERIIHDDVLRRDIIANSFELVKDSTFEIQTAKLVSILQEK